MRTPSRIVTAVLVSATAMSVATACSSSSSTSTGSPATGPTAAGSTGTFHISFSNYTEAAPLFHVLHSNLDTVLRSKQTGVAVKWYDNGGDPQKMLQNVQLMIQDKPQAIVVYPVSTATEGISNLLKQSKIPCVSLNIATPACSFLNIDNSALGVGTAAIIGKIAKQRGWNASNTTVLIGQNAAAGEAVNSCVSNFYASIAPMLGMQAVSASSITATTTKIGANAIQFDGQSTLEPSYTAVKNLLPSVPKGNHIILYTVNNDSTVGALRALTEAGRAGNDNLLIGGLGGDATGIKSLRTDPRWVAEGDIFISWWGEYAVAMAQALAKGAKPPAAVTPLPQVVLDKSTVDKYHQPGSVDIKELPPLVPDNEYLKSGGFLQTVGNVQGL